jgi:serine kinase of HPr protein (carbohydrate metabolism regulator)
MIAGIENVHASAVQLAGQGVIIFGASGSGKTALALALIRQTRRDGHEAWLVADDRVDIERREDHLVASPPASLAGLIEIRGSGVHPVEHIASARLHLMVRLVGKAEAQRMAPEGAVPAAHGLALPCLVLPQGHIQGSIRAILSHLGLYHPVRRKGNSA